jgi:hypothetical protein
MQLDVCAALADATREIQCGLVMQCSRAIIFSAVILESLVLSWITLITTEVLLCRSRAFSDMLSNCSEFVRSLVMIESGLNNYTAQIGQT